MNSIPLSFRSRSAFPFHCVGAACALLLLACSGGPKTAPATSASSPPAAAPMRGPEEGRALFAARCDECHALPEPGAHSPEKWSLILESMKVKAHLTPREEHLVRAYLFANASWTQAPGP